jgi:hypothetical protein
LWRAAERIGAWRETGRDVFAYFNNDVGAMPSPMRGGSTIGWLVTPEPRSAGKT